MKHFMKDTKEFFVDILLPVLIYFLMIVAVALFVSQSVLYYQCSSFESATGKPTQYKLVDSCYVEFKGEWLRFDEYKEIRKDMYIKQEINQ